MAIELISKIKPKNGTAAMVDAVDVEMPDGSRLDAYLETQKSSTNASAEAFAKEVANLKAKDEEIAATATALAKDVGTQLEALSATDEAFAKEVEALKAKDAEVAEQMAVLAEKEQEIMETATALTQQIGEQIDALVAKDQALVAADEALDTRTKALEKRFADMDYGNGIVIEYFRHNIGTKERGEVVESLTLSWKLDRTPVTLTLDGVDVENDGGELKTGQSITADNQGNFRWILEATDNRNKVVRQTSPGFTFLNCVYYGMAEDTGTIDDGFIQSLKTKTSPTSQKGRTITYTGDGTYMWYCLPVSLGKVTFTCDGFPSPFELKGNAIQFTNKLGYKEPYYVYRSENRNSKTLAMVVT